MTDPLRVLFVCTANICRSAYAKVRAESLLAEDAHIEFDSAGTWGFDAAPMDDEMAGQLLTRGVDPSAFRSQRVTAALVRDADLILTASAEHRAFLLEEWPTAFRKTFTLGQFVAEVLPTTGDACGFELVSAARLVRAPVHPLHDIADPYGRGTPAAAACADKIDSLLQQLVARLAGRDPSPESAQLSAK